MDGSSPADCSQMSSLPSGLRGAVAFSLAVHIDRSTEVKNTFLTTTLLLVSSTIWVLSAATEPVLRRLDIRSVPSPC